MVSLTPRPFRLSSYPVPCLVSMPRGVPQQSTDFLTRSVDKQLIKNNSECSQVLMSASQSAGTCTHAHTHTHTSPLVNPLNHEHEESGALVETRELSRRYRTLCGSEDSQIMSNLLQATVLRRQSGASPSDDETTGTSVFVGVARLHRASPVWKCCRLVMFVCCC